MHNINQLLESRAKLKQTTEATTTGLNTVVSKYKTTDLVIAEVTDLINMDFYKWYCKMAHTIGRERFLALASMARCDGNDPKRLFSYLLRKELCGEL